MIKKQLSNVLNVMQLLDPNGEWNQLQNEPQQFIVECVNQTLNNWIEELTVNDREYHSFKVIIKELERMNYNDI